VDGEENVEKRQKDPDDQESYDAFSAGLTVRDFGLVNGADPRHWVVEGFVARAAAEHLARRREESGVLLDIGCGTAEDTLPLARDHGLIFGGIDPIQQVLPPVERPDFTLGALFDPGLLARDELKAPIVAIVALRCVVNGMIDEDRWNDFWDTLAAVMKRDGCPALLDVLVGSFGLAAADAWVRDPGGIVCFVHTAAPPQRLWTWSEFRDAAERRTLSLERPVFGRVAGHERLTRAHVLVRPPRG
jgi:hypothetical protein